MRTVSQRELRNDSGAIMRGLAAGESYRITSRGVDVGVLLPAQHSQLDDLTIREGQGAMEFPPGVRVPETTQDVLAELRGRR